MRRVITGQAIIGSPAVDDASPAQLGPNALARRRRLIVALILLVAAALRLLAVANADPEHTVLTWEIAGYDAAAQRLAATGSYAYPYVVYDTEAAIDYWDTVDLGSFKAPTIGSRGLQLLMTAERNAYVLPGYPAFLAAIYRLTGTGSKRLLAVALVQALLSTLTVFVVYRIASRLGTRTAIVASVFAALYLPSILIVSSILTETVYALLLCLLLLAALRMFERKSIASALLVGAVLGLSLWVRPTALPCAVALFAVLAWSLRHQAPRRFLALVAIAVLVGVAALSPWWIRNATLYGHWVPFATYSAHPILMGYYADRGVSDPTALLAPTTALRNDYELGVHWGRLAWDAERDMLFHPVETVLLRARRVVSSLVRPDGIDLQWTWQYGLAVLSHVVGLCLFALGLLLAARAREPLVLAIASVPIAVVALQAAVIPLTRYYVPVAPLALAVVAWGLVRACTKRIPSLAETPEFAETRR